LVIFVPDDVPVYGPAIRTWIEDYLAPFLEADQGYEVITELLSTYPDYTQVVSRRDAIKAKITEYATTSGVQLFHLVGKSSDYWYLDGPFTAQYWPLEWETKRQEALSETVDLAVPADLAAEDLIPIFVIPAQNLTVDESMQVKRPYYFTDQPYADTNNDDGVPDVVVTRWPIRTDVDVHNLVDKVIAYNWSVYWGTGTGIRFGLQLVGDKDYVQNSGDGLRAQESALAVSSLLPMPSGTLTDLFSVLETDPTLPDYVALTQAAVAEWNYVVAGGRQPFDVVLIFGSASSRYYPGTFFHKLLGVPYSQNFDVADLTSPYYPVVIAASCGSADFVSTNSWYSGYPSHVFGDSVCEDILVHDTGPNGEGQGAIAWIGPTGGSWQRGNEIIAAAFVEKLYARPTARLAETWLETMQDLFQEYATDEIVLETLRSYAFLGDPASRMNPTFNNPVGVEGVTVGEAPVLSGAVPNPALTPTAFSIGLQQRGRVRLTVYDVAGRMVRGLLDEVRDPGSHRVIWDRRDDSGQLVASGVYFVRLETGAFRVTGKAVILE
jgi:hypothetical protein